MLRRLISTFNRSITERLVSSRRTHTASLRVWFEPETNSPHQREVARNMAISGETVDLSRTGIAFLTSSIRINEKYLVGQDRKLNIEIDLPSGQVVMQVVGRRYEKVGANASTEKFLVGVHIVRIESESNAVYDHFLRHGPGRRKKAAVGLELGLD